MGNDPTAGFLEMAVRELLSAVIPAKAKEKILGGNLRRMLTPILNSKGIPL